MPDIAVAVAFVSLAVAALCGALATVLTRDAARVSFWLLVTMIAVSGALLVLSVGYVAIVALLLLAGAVPALMLLAALSHSREPSQGPRRWLRLAVSALVSLALGGALMIAILQARLPSSSPSVPPLGLPELGSALFTRWPLAIIATAAVLLTVLVGAAGRGGRES